MITPVEYTEHELIALLKQREEKAFAYLYNRYGGALFSVAIRVVQEKQAAADVLQDAFVKIWKSIDLYDTSKGKLYTWMSNVVRNSAIDFVRSKQATQERKTNSLEDNKVATDERFVTQIQVEHFGLKNMVGDLKDDHRVIIDMAYFRGYTQDEISKILNIPLGTVKTRARAALQQLRILFS